MNLPTLADGLQQAGSPIKLLWHPSSPPPAVPVIPPEIAGWREEQAAWRDGVAFFDLSHHMTDLVMEGPDVVRLLSSVSANNYENFAVGQAKQFVPVTSEGYIVTDGILARLGEHKFNLIGIGACHNWVLYHAEKGKFDVKFTLDPDSQYRQQGDPLFFRFQVQGPKASEVLERAFGGPMPAIKFFHFAEVSLAGKKFNALRHGMAGQAGFEFFGDWKDGAAVKQALLEAGKASGIVQVGGLAYYTSGIESGWIPTPLPAIFESKDLEDYRRFVGLYSYEGQNPLQGSFYSENVADYYLTPFELGYGKSVAFNHDFIGRKALEKLKGETKRQKVTLVWNPEDVKRVFGSDHGFILSYTKDRIEVGGKLVGMSMYAGTIGPAGTIYALGVVDTEFATPGTQVEVLWGQHPGPANTDPNILKTFDRIRATVQPAPIDDHARTAYRKA